MGCIMVGPFVETPCFMPTIRAMTITDARKEALLIMVFILICIFSSRKKHNLVAPTICYVLFMAFII